MEKFTSIQSLQNITRIFDLQKANERAVKLSTAKQRKEKLSKLQRAISGKEAEIYAALKSDLRKPEFESAAMEVNFTQTEIDFAINNLSDWMEPQRVPSNLVNTLTRNHIVYDPKGLCLIISPWNYPFQLLMSPLVSAIAAGNCCILKPSELAPATGSVLAALIRETFKENEIALMEGDAELATQLLSMPFHHIFFTGSTSIGKVVMEAASKHLTSVTLELGGKSPAIIDKHADLKKAADKIAWGKWTNAGQTCIAPDYVFVHASQRDEFVELLKQSIQKFYFQNNQLNKDDYGKIVSERHFARLKNLTEDAIAKGAKVQEGGTFNETDGSIVPTILTHVDLQSLIMKEEIFGPILPIITYSDIQETIEYVGRNDHPLALYIFSNKKSVVDTIIKQTSSGGVCVNDVLIHISNPFLSFGGVGASGMGGSHGFYGFRSFSHERSVMIQNRFLDFGKIVYPPFKGKKWMMKLLKKLV
jgi:aldehyde dehydrogenase (NAD+)